MSPKRKLLLAKLERDRRQAKADLYFFCRNVLGYSLMVPHVHKEMCAFIQKEHPRNNEQLTKLLLEPRNSFKSSVGSVGYTLWRLANNPDMKILLTNEKLEKSKKFLKEIKWHITDNEKFKLLFGEWSTEKKIGKRWSADKIDILPCGVASREASVEVSGVEGSDTGNHYDLVICDDLHGKSNTTTKEQVQKVVDYYKDLGSVLKPDGEMIIIGTRWHDLDLYQYVMEMKEKLGSLSNIVVLIKSAYNEDGSLYFPEVLSEQFLKSQRMKQGAHFYGMQYLNQVVSLESALIKQENILKYGNKDADFWANCIHFITADLAYTENERSDSTAIVVNAVVPNSGTWFVRHYDVFKTGDPDKVIDKLFEYNRIYKPLVIGIEKNNYVQWLQHALEDAMRKRDEWLNIEPLAHYGKSNNKALRLRKLAPRFNNRRCYIHEVHTELEDELLKLTYDGARGKDDLLDALAMQEEIVHWGSSDTANRDDNATELQAKPKPMRERLAERYRSLMPDDEYEDAWLYA